MTREEDEVGQASSRNTKYESLQSEYLGISLFHPTSLHMMRGPVAS